MTTAVDILWENADTYRFTIRKTRGRDTPILATGSLKATTAHSTLVSGSVKDDNWLAVLTFLGIITFFVITQMPGAPLFLMLFVVIVFVNFFASATERQRFIDYITEMMPGYGEKRKRTDRLG